MTKQQQDNYNAFLRAVIRIMIVPVIKKKGKKDAVHTSKLSA